MFTNEYFFDGVSARTGGEGGQPNADSSRQGEGEEGQKSLKMCGHPLWMAPVVFIVNFKHISHIVLFSLKTLSK